MSRLSDRRQFRHGGSARPDVATDIDGFVGGSSSGASLSSDGPCVPGHGRSPSADGWRRTASSFAHVHIDGRIQLQPEPEHQSRLTAASAHAASALVAHPLAARPAPTATTNATTAQEQWIAIRSAAGSQGGSGWTQRSHAQWQVGLPSRDTLLLIIGRDHQKRRQQFTGHFSQSDAGQ